MPDRWERWVHSQDHTVVYEARRASTLAGSEGYEVRKPDEPGGATGEVLGVIDAPTWEAIYEREVTDDRNEG